MHRPASAPSSGRPSKIWSRVPTPIEINRLLTQRSALVFPQVHLTIEEQLAFAGTVGKVFLVGGKDVQKISMDPEINPVADYTRGAFYWHIDGANDDVPAKATMLNCRILADEGTGDTDGRQYLCRL